MYPNLSVSKIPQDDLMQYLPLVKKVVRRIDNNDYLMDSDDMEMVGFIGLMDAMEKYDSSKNVPFESYAALRIRGTVIDEQRRLGKVSRSKISKLNKYYQAKERLEVKLQRTPTELEICKEMGLNIKHLYDIHETLQLLINYSLDSTIPNNEDEDFTLMDVIKDETCSPDELLIKEEQKEELVSAIKKLSEREQLLLSLYYVEELQLKEIAIILDLSIPRVSQIHTKAISKLRFLLEQKYSA